MMFSLQAWVACGSSDSDDGDGTSSPIDASVERRSAVPNIGPAAPLADGGTTTPPPTPQKIDAACNVFVTSVPIASSTHVPEGTPVAYSSNPPSSGNHYPRWANFQEFPQPVADGYLVHSMEHGAVLLLYKCVAGTTECNDIQAALRKTRDEATTDPMCEPNIRVRIIVAPRPELDVPIAAAAWGFTYKADCFDAPSIAQFIRDHYAHGPEDFCFAGATNL